MVREYFEKRNEKTQVIVHDVEKGEKDNREVGYI